MTDVEVPAAAAGPSGEGSGSVAKKGKRFEIKKWNAVALWAWGKSSNLHLEAAGDSCQIASLTCTDGDA